MHTTVAPLNAALGWMTDPASEVAAHYVVALDGRAFSLVDERDAARHAGRVLDASAELIRERGGDPNLYTVGIELEDDGDPLTVERPAAQYAAAARLVAEIASRWSVPIDRRHVIGHREVFAAKDCPGNVDLDRVVAEAQGVRRPAEQPRAQRVACLVPARNAEAELPEMIAGARRFADFVVALDDGSTDGTGAVLESAPAVERVIANPPRPGYSGWDDAANRRRLADAAIAMGADWLVFLDADERIDPADAAALRDFLLADALPGLVYGLRLHREWQGEIASEPLVVYRVLHASDASDLPARRLHFNPVPSGLESERFVRTTIRLRHLDSPSRLDARLEKYRQADPAGEFAVERNALLEPPPGPMGPWLPRSVDLEVLDTESEADTVASPRLACLLPVRNGEDEIPGYLASAASLADFVLALDDGSTDATAELLECSPAVAQVIRRPRRDGYAGWDDAANRQSLLDAAVAAGADWVLFLDADERIDPDDAEALRRFLDDGADPSCAYGFRVHRMIDDETRFDANDLWVYRLFAARPGVRLPQGRLHALPVPESIPPERRLRTTLRIKHLASLTPQRRQARVDKYAEADPEREWQRDYSDLARPEGELQEWEPRPPGLEVLIDSRPARSQGERPVLSAIVIAQDDAATIESSVRSVVEQDCPESFEVIVVVSGSPRTAATVREKFPTVLLVELAKPVLPGAARNAGLRLAGGDYVSFPGSHVELRPGSLAARIEAHDRGYSMVTGSMLNGTTTRSGWASYFIDHSTSLPGRSGGELEGAPAHCSYTRDALLEVRGFPEDLRAGEDTVVNQELDRRGHRGYREPTIQLVHRSRCRTPMRLIRHHFGRGRAMARIILAEQPGRLRLARFLLSYSRRRIAETEWRVRRWAPELRSQYGRARPLVVAGILAALAGAVFELVVGGPASGRRAPT